MSRFKQRAALSGAVLGGLVAGLWALGAFAPHVATSSEHEAATTASRSASEGAHVEQAVSAKTPAALHPAAQQRAPGGDPLTDLDVSAHGPSELAARDARQHELFARLSLALEELDFARARMLLTEHSASFPDDGWRDQHRGFELVLDCLERRDDKGRLTSDAERYLKEERISPIRRSVRQVCLEGRGFRRRT